MTFKITQTNLLILWIRKWRPVLFFKSFSSMKCVFVVSVAKHRIISTLMFPIDFFQMGFFMRHRWPPRNQLHIRAVQNATWKVNLEGAITVHTTRKRSLYGKYHSLDHLQATYSRSPLCFLQLNYPKVLNLSPFSLYNPDFPLLLIALGLGQSESGPTRTRAGCWVFAESYSRNWAI